METFLGVFLLLFILFQFINKRGNRQTEEVVVYDSKTIAGKLSSLGVRTQVSLLIGGVLLIVIAAFSYLSFRNYSEIKELIANEQYLEAESRMIESRRSVLPLFELDELEYDLRLKWASAAIDAEEWEQAVNQIRELKKDSIPQDLIPSAFESYYGYINSHIPFKDKKKFDECTIWQGDNDDVLVPSIYTYREYLMLFNMDSLLISAAYEIFHKLKKISTIESRKSLIRGTNSYQIINSYLVETNDTNFVAREYIKNPRIIINLDSNRAQVSIDSQEYIKAVSARRRLEISLIEYCLNNNLISLEFLIRAADYAFSPVNYVIADGRVEYKMPILKLAVEKAYRNLLTYHRWGEEDFTTETRFLVNFLDLEYRDSPASVKGDKLAFQLKQFLSVYSKDVLIMQKEEIGKTREKIDSLLKWENNWSISFSEFTYLNFCSLDYIREKCLVIGNCFRDNREYDALYWYDLGLGMNNLVPYHNSPKPSYAGFRELTNFHTSKIYYRLRANTKWNIKPYGAKLGYCDDLRKSMEFGLDCANQYVNDCD